MFPNNKKIFRPTNAQQQDTSNISRRNPLLMLPKELQELQAQKEALAKRIDTIQQRLIFAYSEPLNDHCIELMKQDMQLASQMTDLLVKLEKKTPLKRS
jgi:hypothetical protein